MRRNQIGRIGASLVALALALVVYLAVPPEPRAQAATDPRCNLYNTGNVCKEQESCVFLLFYKQCTKEIWRQPLQGDFGGGTDEERPDDPTLV